MISGFHARIDHAALGRPIEASIDIWLATDRKRADDRSAFEEFVIADDRVVECFHLTGPLDFRLRARVESAEDLNSLLQGLRAKGGAAQTDSRLLLERIPVHEE